MSKIPGSIFELDDVSPVPPVEGQEADPRVTPGRAVHVNLRDSGGVEFGVDNPIPISEQPDLVLAKSVTASSATANLVHTPAAGMAIRLWWYSLGASPSNSAAVTAGVRFTSGGTDFHSHPLSQYGGIVAHNFKGGDGYVQGGADESLYMNLSAAQAVTCNIDYQEVTP